MPGPGLLAVLGVQDVLVEATKDQIAGDHAGPYPARQGIGGVAQFRRQGQGGVPVFNGPDDGLFGADVKPDSEGRRRQQDETEPKAHPDPTEGFQRDQGIVWITPYPYRLSPRLGVSE